MATKAQDDFNILMTKALKQLSVSRGVPKDVQQLAIKGAKLSRKGYDFFIKWFDSLPYEDKEVVVKGVDI